jgi:ADP-heptose:LPS heptosyltransferase
MQWLEYRLNEIYDNAQRRALFSDLADAYPDLRAFFAAVDGALEAEHDDAVKECEYLQSVVEDLEEDLAQAQAANDELRADVEYWKEQAEA